MVSLTTSSIPAPSPQTEATQVAPPVVAMGTWAKLYPGGTITKNETRKLMNLTSWDIGYKVDATPEQIDAFYQALARQEGFDKKLSFGGLTRYDQSSTNNHFSYSIFEQPGGSRVLYTAYYFDGQVAP